MPETQEIRIVTPGEIAKLQVNASINIVPNWFYAAFNHALKTNSVIQPDFSVKATISLSEMVWDYQRSIDADSTAGDGFEYSLATVPAHAAKALAADAKFFEAQRYIFAPIFIRYVKEAGWSLTVSAYSRSSGPNEIVVEQR